MAASGYKALRKMNLKPGEDILITGFDDSRFCIMMEPHLTSYEFTIDESVNFDQVLKRADAQLYIEKKEKKKRICIYKNVEDRRREV